MDAKRFLMARLALALSVFVLLSLAPACGWASGDDPNTITGRVEDMDSLKSMITVSYADPVSGEKHELDILVPEETKIMNGSEGISFLDIEQFDPVTVTYVDDGAGNLKAKEILELNQANK